ncbi:MAG: (d)CMP kinase [Armatimonadota bacterium]
MTDTSEHVYTIAIDGPAGSGKSTVAKTLADRLGWLHLDSGATYRAMAAIALSRGILVDDAESLGKLAQEISVEIRPEANTFKVFADGIDVTSIIRSPDVSKASSPVSAVPAVRERLVALQRDIASHQNTVAEGRDMGTVVFPDAAVKAYLIASPEERARRRVEDFRLRNEIIPFDQVLHEIKERDHRDSSRPTSPLRPAEDAHIIQTDLLTADEVVEEIIALYQAARV